MKQIKTEDMEHHAVMKLCFMIETLLHQSMKAGKM